MFSALPSNSDIARRSRHVSNVPRGVIDRLEMIQVERQQGQWSAAPFGPRDLGADARDELAPIPDTGQRVGGGKMLQP